MNTSITYEEVPFDPAATAAESSLARARRIDERALSLAERYLQAVINRRLMILGIVLLSMIVGVIAYLMATPQYRATARLEIARTQPKVLSVQGVEVEDRGRDIQFYETQYQLLRAKSLAERVARALSLQNNDAFFEMFGGEKVDPGAPKKALSANDQADRLAAATSILLQNIEIKPVGNSNLVDVHFSSPDPALSARVANAWAQEYIQANLDRRFAATADARGFLEQRLNQLRTRLETSERELVAYASGKGIVTLSSGGDAKGGGGGDRTLVMDDLTTLNNALSQAISERISAESAVRAATTNPNSPSQMTIATLRQRRAELAGRYAALLTKFQPGYPEAEALRNEILTLDQAITAENGRGRGDAEATYRSALAKENQLRARLEGLKTGYNSQRNNMIEYQILDREVDTNRQLYDSLLQRYKEIGVVGVGSNNISVVDMADVPGRPFEPDLPSNLAIAVLLGLVIAAALVVVAEEVDQSLRDPADVQRELGLPLIGTIPRVEDKDVADELRDKKTQIYESYLAVRTNLSFLTDHGAPKVFMLTSSRPNEGKSLSAYALARLFAETGSRIVLLDADMRNTRLDDLVILDEKRPGLSNYLSGSNESADIVQRPEGQNFDMIAAGPIPPNAAELLASERFRELLAQLRDTYDHVIIDAPPVLGLADAPLLSRTVDGVLFVIESNVGKLRLVRGALKRLELPGAKIFGALVTKLDARNLTYGYGYGYGYGSNYGYGRARARKEAEAQASA